MFENLRAPKKRMKKPKFKINMTGGIYITAFFLTLIAFPIFSFGTVLMFSHFQGPSGYIGLWLLLFLIGIPLSLSRYFKTQQTNAIQCFMIVLMMIAAVLTFVIVSMLKVPAITFGLPVASLFFLVPRLVVHEKEYQKMLDKEKNK